MRNAWVVAAVLAAVAGSPVLAGSQVVASPGVTLTEAAQAKFNHDSRQDDRYFTPVPGNSGITPQMYSAAGLSPVEAQGWTLEQVYVAGINRESGRDDQQLTPVDASRTTAGMAYGQDADHWQLALSAGLSREEAADMSMAEIANAKLNADH